MSPDSGILRSARAACDLGVPAVPTALIRTFRRPAAPRPPPGDASVAAEAAGGYMWPG